jgi:hypothetical protein
MVNVFNIMGMISIFVQMVGACDQKNYRAGFYCNIWHFLTSLFFLLFVYLADYEIHGVVWDKNHESLAQYQTVYSPVRMIFIFAFINLALFARRPRGYFIRRGSAN